MDWFKFTVGANGASNVRVETAGASGDTEMWLYGPNSSATQIAYDDDTGNGDFSLITRSSLTAGTYYIKVIEYGNNGTIAAYTLRASWSDGQPADLTRESDNISRTSGAPGDTFTITHRVRNAGTAPAGATKVYYYVNKDARSTAAAAKVGERDLAALGAGAVSGEISFPWTAPANLAVGNYFIGYWIDGPQSVAESNEDNNAWWWENVRIGPPTPNEPNDTAAQAVTLNQTQNITDSIHQAGNEDWFRFTLSIRSEIVIETLGSGGDTIMYLYGPNSPTTLITSDDDDGAGNFSRILRQGANALNPGVYYVKVQEYGNNGTIDQYSLLLGGPTVEPPWDLLVVCKLGIVPTEPEWESLDVNFKRAANFLYDATDGQVRLGAVTMKNFNVIDAVLANIMLTDASEAKTVPGWWIFGYIVLGKDISPVEEGWWHAYSTIVHELGHYNFGLGDEYTDRPGGSQNRYCRSTVRSGTLMDRAYHPTWRSDGISEFCTPSGASRVNSAHDPRDLATGSTAQTAQDTANHESCWQTIHDYNNAIQIPSADPLPGPCSKSTDSNSVLSHEPLEAESGVAALVSLTRPHP